MTRDDQVYLHSALSNLIQMAGDLAHAGNKHHAMQITRLVDGLKSRFPMPSCPTGLRGQQTNSVAESVRTVEEKNRRKRKDGHTCSADKGSLTCTACNTFEHGSLCECGETISSCPNGVWVWPKGHGQECKPIENFGCTEKKPCLKPILRWVHSRSCTSRTKR